MATLVQLILSALILIFVPIMPSVKATNCTYVSVGGRVVSADCSNLGWTQIPKDLPRTVISLDISGNRLTSLPNCCFCGLSCLKSLDLSNNQIVKLENASFSGLFELQWLSLRKNTLRMAPGTYAARAFKDLARLTFLDLHSNQPVERGQDLAYPDVALSSLGSLETLRMDGLVTNVDLGPGFSKLEKLGVLDMNNEAGICPMTSLSETFFFHINTTRPLTVNLTDCWLRSVHHNTFSFLPTLYSLDLNSNRHLNFPPFVEASKSLRWTSIRVLNISCIHRETDIEIKAEYFKYLGFTWLEHLIVSNVEAYNIDLKAIYNLPTSLTYLSVYDNKLVNATFLLGLYFLPNMDILQVSRQNHFSSNLHLQMRSENLPLRQDIQEPSIKRVAGGVNDRIATWKPVDQNVSSVTMSKSRDEIGFKKIRDIHFAPESSQNEKEDFLPHSSRAARKVGLMKAGLTNQHFISQTPTAARIARPTTALKTNRQSKNTVLSLAKNVPSFNTKELQRNTISGNNEKLKKTPQVTSVRAGFLVKRKLKPRKRRETEQTNASTSVINPSHCLDSAFRKARNARFYESLAKVKTFLSVNSIRKETDDSVQRSRLRKTSVSSDTMLPTLRSSTKGAKKHDASAWLSNEIKVSGGHDDRVILPPSVRVLYGSEMKLGYVLPRLHFYDNNLQHVDMSKNSLPCFIGPWLGLKKLRYFDLSWNFAVYLSENFFEDMPNLTHLYLQGNFLGESFANDSGGQILSGLKNLKFLDLGNNFIKQLPERAFHAQRKITHLSLARNAMTNFKARVSHMTSLTFVDLSDNNIGFLQRERIDDFHAISKLSNLSIDLSQNPLSCGCDSLDFWYWVTRRTSRVHFHRLEEYKCTLRNGSEISYRALTRELDSLWLQCHGQDFLNVAAGMLVGLFFLLSLLGVLHYKRWRLRYFYYVGLRRYHHPYLCHHVAHDAQIIRDVFISFDDQDPRIRLFIQDVLRPRLDGEQMTHYISEIDFANREIRDIIPEAVLGARKTLALLSSRFFPSYERELEFNMAVYHEEEIHRQVVVPVQYEAVDWSSLPPEVQVYLGEHTCLVYKPDDQAEFLDALIQRIKAEIRK